MTRSFYTMSDATHFPGLVALLNSLRLVGHDEPIVVLDLGLTQKQRRRLAPHVVLVDRPEEPLRLFKSYAPRLHPADAMVLIDADVIVVRRLDTLFEVAEQGRVAAFADPVSPRFFPEWRGFLSLGPLVKRTYVNAGVLALPRATALRLLPQVAHAGRLIDPRRTINAQHGDPTYPFFFPDQDVWNGLFAAEPPGAVVAFEARFAPHPPFTALDVEDATTLACGYEDGTKPFLLHHVLVKPWVAPTRASAYTQLFTRLVHGDDVTLSLDPRELPARLRPEGALVRADAARAHVLALARGQRGRLGLRRRLAQRRSEQFADPLFG